MVWAALTRFSWFVRVGRSFGAAGHIRSPSCFPLGRTSQTSTAKSILEMNRIQLLEDHSDTARKPSSAAAAQRKRYRATRAGSQREYSFFVPLHYEPNYAYPLLIWLHGPHDDHRQLKRVMPHVSMRNYVAVAPRCPTAASGHSQPADPWRQETAGIFQALRSVDDCITQAAARYHIAPQRVFLAGFDCGGTMALRLGLAAPDRFAGVASIGGPFPDGHHPMSNLIAARQLPLLIAQGRDSQSYPIGRVCEELRLFHVAGMCVNLRQYPCEDELTTQMLSDLDAWMMQLVTGIDPEQSSRTQFPLDELN